MAEEYTTDNMLAVLEGYCLPTADDIALALAADFRQRRVEQGLTRRAVAGKSGVPLSNIARFEQKGLISLNNLILLAISLGYLGEIRSVFAKPKYSTMEELTRIRRNMGKKRAYNRKSHVNEEDLGKFE